MEEILAIDPVPEGREDKYLWIDRMVARGFKVQDACKVAGVPRGSYYMIHRARTEGPRTRQGDAA